MHLHMYKIMQNMSDEIQEKSLMVTMSADFGGSQGSDD